MDIIAELGAVVHGFIDVEYLGTQLVREPIVQGADGSWRALTPDEAQQVGRLVGEAVGRALMQSPS